MTEELNILLKRFVKSRKGVTILQVFIYPSTHPLIYIIYISTIYQDGGYIILLFIYLSILIPVHHLSIYLFIYLSIYALEIHLLW